MNLALSIRNENARTANKSIAAIGAGRCSNQQQCISKLYIRRTEFYRSLVLNIGFLFINLASVPGGQLVNSPTAAILNRCKQCRWTTFRSITVRQNLLCFIGKT